MVGEQIRRRRDEIDGVKRMKGKVEEVLAGLGVVSVGDGVVVGGEAEGEREVVQRLEEKRKAEKEKAMWAALDDIEV